MKLIDAKLKCEDFTVNGSAWVNPRLVMDGAYDLVIRFPLQTTVGRYEPNRFRDRVRNRIVRYEEFQPSLLELYQKQTNFAHVNIYRLSR